MTALFSERAAGNVVEAAKDGEHADPLASTVVGLGLTCLFPGRRAGGDFDNLRQGDDDASRRTRDCRLRG